MKYIINHGWPFSSTAFEIESESRQKAYRVTRGFFGRGYSLTNAAGEALLVLRDVGIIKSVFQIWRDEAMIGSVTYERGMKSRYRVMAGDVRAFGIQPNFWRTRFDFVNQEGRLAVFTSPSLLPPRPATLEIFDERQELMALAATIAVIKITHRALLARNRTSFTMPWGYWGRAGGQ